MNLGMYESMDPFPGFPRMGVRISQGVTNISPLFRTGRVESMRDALLQSTLYLPVLEEANYCRKVRGTLSFGTPKKPRLKGHAEPANSER